MDEQTTTEAPVESGGQNINGIAIDDQGRAVPQPEETEQAEAGQETTEAEEVSQEATTEPVQGTQEETPADDSEQEQLAKFAKTKGLTLDSDNAIKAAKMAMNAEKLMHEKTVKASELEKAIDEGITQEAEDAGFKDEDRLDLIRIKTKLSVREFFEQNPQAKPLEQAMIAELANKPHLAGDLESLYALAAVKSLDEVKSQGKREALTDLAQKQQAAVPRGNAVNPSTMSSTAITPQNVDSMVARMSVEEYQKRLPEINKAMAG